MTVEARSIFPARWLWIACVASLASSAGCATAAHRSRLLTQTSEVKADERAMRSSLYDYLVRFQRSAELTSKRIVADSGDREIARRAVYWRLGVTSEAQRAAFRTDVLIALLDVWTLALQQREYFSSGEGRDAFGSFQPLVRQASESMVDDIIETAKPFASAQGLQNGANYAGEWAAEHPIRDIMFARRSIASRFASGLIATDTEHTPTQALANMENSIEDLLQRVNVYADQFPRQALAQSDELFDSFLEKPRLVHTFEMIESMRGDMGTMTHVVAGMPEMIRAERVAAFESVAAERALMLEAMTRERLAMQEVLKQERGLVMGDAKEMLRDTLKTLVAERQAAMHELPEATAQAFALNERKLESLIDRMLWGFALLLAVAGTVFMLVIILARRSGFFAPRDSVVPEAPKVVAKT